MTTALANLPSLAVPSAELLLAIIVGYILLIGPLSYLVLRRLDRRELAWGVSRRSWRSSSRGSPTASACR